MILRFKTLFPLLALATSVTALAQTVRYDSGGFEAPVFSPGNLATQSFLTGQDGWVSTPSAGGTIDYSQITVQTQDVASGNQAVTIEASGHSLDYLHMWRNTQFSPLSNPAEPVLDIRMKLKLDSSSTPSEAWGFQAQAGPGPGSGIFSWDIHSNGRIHYIDSVSLLEIDTGFDLQKDVWHEVVTSLDYAALTVTVYVDGVVATTFAANNAITFDFFAFASIFVQNLGDDRLHLDEFKLVSRAAGPLTSSIGVNYCGPAVANSSGFPGTISAFGSSVAAANDVTLKASGLPTGQFAIFLGSATSGFFPNAGSSQGHLCLSGPFGRYNQAGQILFSGINGNVELTLDLTSTPTANGPIAITAGQTWHYQLWNRDVIGGQSTSNFTNGLAVTFQ